MDLVTSQAMKAGFYRGVVVDFPNSAKAKKFFLVLMTEGSALLPEALGTDDMDNNLQVKYAKRKATRNIRGKPLKNSRAWIVEKEEGNQASKPSLIRSIQAGKKVSAFRNNNMF